MSKLLEVVAPVAPALASTGVPGTSTVASTATRHQ